MKINYIAVSGYGWSGSGVVVDLLREFDGFDGLDMEFSMIWEPHGLLDLEKALVDDWDFLRHDMAIRDFIDYCKVINSKGGYFSSIGFNLSNKLDVDFIKETYYFINQLKDFQYKGETRLHNYKLNAFKLFVKRIKRKIFKSVTYKDMYMARPNKELFLNKTKIYMDKIFKNYAQNRKINNIILDQSIPVSNIIKTMSYFNNIKSIVIDRDPRDIYVDLINHKALIGVESIVGSRESTIKYIKWHKIIRNKNNYDKNSSQILRLRFEDIILNYDKSLELISKFLNIKEKHIKKNSFFKPEVSEKNIGLWKTYKNQDEIDFIYQELKEYCYES